jgi:predicted amidophosphoribosyltransferase
MFDPLRLPPALSSFFDGPCCPGCGAHLTHVIDGWHCFRCLPHPSFHPEIGETTTQADGW